MLIHQSLQSGESEEWSRVLVAFCVSLLYVTAPFLFIKSVLQLRKQRIWMACQNLVSG